MELKDVLSFKNIIVIGDTITEGKTAYEIKHKLLKEGYNVYPVYKEIKDINEVSDVELIDLCINPIKGLEILKSLKKTPKACLIQDGAGSEEIYKLLDERNIPYINGCILQALRFYK